MRAKALLEAQGLTVYMTRTADEFIPLEDRVRFANMHPTALFIAIHFNSGDAGRKRNRDLHAGAARGAIDGRGRADALGLAAQTPAMCATRKTWRWRARRTPRSSAHARLYDRGIKRARFVVIRDITIPGVLDRRGVPEQSLRRRT